MARVSGGFRQVIPLRLHKKYVLVMCDQRDLPAIEDLARLVLGNDEEQLLRREAARLRAHMLQGEIALLYLSRPGQAELVGVAIATQSEDGEHLEIAHTVVARRHRGLRMAELLASAALVRQASLVTSLTAIYSTVHPHNVACRSALEKIGADLCSVSDVFGSTPYLDVALRERLDAYDARGWTEPPLVAVLGPSVVQHAAQLMIAAASAEGLAWDGGARVYLEGPWTDGGEAPPGERAGGLLSQIRAMARGEVPEIALQVDADNRVRLRA